MLHESRTTAVFNYLGIITSLNITCSAITILLPYKILQIGSIILPGGVLVFPLTYLFDDIVAEVYGYQSARQMIWIKVACLSLFSIAISIIVRLPSPPTWQLQSAYDQVFGESLRLLVGFIVGLLVSDFANTYLIAKWQKLMDGAHFWLRSIGAAAIGEAIFSIVVGLIVYIGILSFKEYIMLTINVWIFKMIYAILMAYPGAVVVNYLKAKEGKRLAESMV